MKVWQRFLIVPIGIYGSWFFAMQASTTPLEGMRIWYIFASIGSVLAVPLLELIACG